MVGMFSSAHVLAGVVVFLTLSSSALANPVPWSEELVARVPADTGPRDLKIVGCKADQEKHLREVLKDAATLGREGRKMTDRNSKACVRNIDEVSLLYQDSV